MATYSELRQLFGNGDLANKIEVAVIVAAEVIRSEDAGTANHANRLLWAKKAFANTYGIREEILKAVLAANKAATVATITGATDAVLQTAVDSVINLFADGN